MKTFYLQNESNTSLKTCFLVVSLFKCLHFINAEHSSLIFPEGSTCRKYFLKTVSEKKPFLRPDMRKCLKPFLVYLFFPFFYLTNFSIINLVECSYLCFLTWIIFIKIQLLVCWQSIPSLPLAPLSLSQTFLCFFLLDDNSLHWLVGCNTFSKLHELLSEFLVQFETYALLLTYFWCNIL